MDYCSEVNKNGYIHHLIKKTHLKKNFYLRNFIIGLVLSVAVCILSMIFREKLMEMAENVYNISAYDIRRLYIAMKWLWMLFLIQFALVPFITLSMLEGHLRKEA